MAVSDSPELRTIKKCTPRLETALNGLDRELVHFLNHGGFFGEDVADKILNPVTLWTEADKAGELVKCIRRRVKQDPPSYHVLLHRFKQSGNFYEPIVRILEAEFATQRREDLSYLPHESNTLPGGPQLPNNSPSHATIPGSSAHLPNTSPRDMMTPGFSAGVRNTSPNDVVTPGRSPHLPNTSLGVVTYGSGAYLPTTSPTSEHSAQQVPRYSPVPGTSSTIPHATSTPPGQCKPTYEDYERCIPQQDRWKLNEKVDFERDGIDLHLGELADACEKWEDIAPLLELSAIEIDDIMRDFHTQADRRRAALKKWKGRYGFKATYGTLLRACLSKDSLKCADKIVTLLGATAGGPTLNYQQAAHMSHQAPPPTSFIPSSQPWTHQPTNPPPQPHAHQTPQLAAPPFHQHFNDLHTPAMAQLVAMGFVDIALNAKLLQRHNNVVYDVVNELVQIISANRRDVKIGFSDETAPMSSHPPSQPPGYHPGATYTNSSSQQTRDAVGYQTQTVVADDPQTVDRHQDTGNIPPHAAKTYPHHAERGRDGSQHLGGGNGMSTELSRERDLNAIDGETILSKNPGRYQNRVEKVISDLTPQQVLKLGQELGLYFSTLKKMPQDSIHGEMVHAWLIKMDDVPGDPTWRAFARGLAEQRLWGMVDTVRQRYPSCELQTLPDTEAGPRGASSYPPTSPGVTSDRLQPSAKKRLNHSLKFDLKNITAALDIVPPKKYMRLALNLGVRTRDVEISEADHNHSNSERVLIDIVNLWMCNVTDPKPSWASLEEALKSL